MAWCFARSIIRWLPRALVGELIERFTIVENSSFFPPMAAAAAILSFFPARCMASCWPRREEKGARTVVWAHAADVLEVPTVEEGILLNLNNPDMLKHIADQEKV